LQRLIMAGIIAMGLLGLPGPASAVECADFWSWVEKGCRRVVDTYEQGGNELIVSGYSYHLPSTYTPEKRAELNSQAWGGGWGRTVEDPNGDTHTVSAFAFLESHKRVQWNVAYTYFKYWGAREGLQPGLGYSVFVMQRPDIAGGVPIPAALPQASLRLGKATLVFTYIPTLNGGVNHGSTLYVLGRYALY
jgi:lipid IVA palmitoyltransferase